MYVDVFFVLCINILVLLKVFFFFFLMGLTKVRFCILICFIFIWYLFFWFGVGQPEGAATWDCIMTLILTV